MLECYCNVGLAAGAVRARQATFKANLVAKGRKTCPSRDIFGRYKVALAMALQARSQKGGKKRAQGAEAAAPIAQEVAGLVGLA